VTENATMHDDNQILIPDSFIALFCDARKRLTVSRDVLAARYEFCEDMAHMLTEHCSNVHHRDGVDDGEILRRCLKGLHTPPSTVEPLEATWVVRRTAELLQWPWADLMGDDDEGAA